MRCWSWWRAGAPPPQKGGLRCSPRPRRLLLASSSSSSSAKHQHTATTAADDRVRLFRGAGSATSVAAVVGGRRVRSLLPSCRGGAATLSPLHHARRRFQSLRAINHDHIIIRTSSDPADNNDYKLFVVAPSLPRRASSSAIIPLVGNKASTDVTTIIMPTTFQHEHLAKKEVVVINAAVSCAACCAHDDDDGSAARCAAVRGGVRVLVRALHHLFLFSSASVVLLSPVHATSSSPPHTITTPSLRSGPPLALIAAEQAQGCLVQRRGFLATSPAINSVVKLSLVSSAPAHFHACAGGPGGSAAADASVQVRQVPLSLHTPRSDDSRRGKRHLTEEVNNPRNSHVRLLHGDGDVCDPRAVGEDRPRDVLRNSLYELPPSSFDNTLDEPATDRDSRGNEERLLSYAAGGVICRAGGGVCWRGACTMRTCRQPRS